MKTRWHVHVGAHKSATTHLQRILRSNEETLLQNGVDCLPWRQINPLIRQDPSRATSGLDVVKAFAKGGRSVRASERYANALRTFRRNKPVTIISDEDQLGFTQDLMRPRFYDGSERYTILNSLPDRESVDIYLSVRSFEALFVSAFCEMLKPFHDARARLEARQRTLRDTPPSWFDLAERLADNFPEARVHVWTFEDYVRDPAFVIKTLTGLELDGLDGRPAPETTRAPSLEAIRLAEELDPSLKMPERMEIVRDLFINSPKQPGEVLRMFSDEEAAWLRDCYTRDLERIQDSSRVTLLRPQAAAVSS